MLKSITLQKLPVSTGMLPLMLEMLKSLVRSDVETTTVYVFYDLNEGVKFGIAIELPHDIGTVGEARIREVFSKTNDSEGDRTTNTLKRGSECTKGTYLDQCFKRLASRRA